MVRISKKEAYIRSREVKALMEYDAATSISATMEHFTTFLDNAIAIGEAVSVEDIQAAASALEDSDNRQSEAINKACAALKKAVALREHRYMFTEPRIPKPSILSETLKHAEIDAATFRRDLRVNPSAFNRLLNMIQGNEVFVSRSNRPQVPVAIQLAVFLFRAGKYGNGGTAHEAKRYADMGVGTVGRCEARVVRALLALADYAFRPPSSAEKAAAQAFVARHSCDSWEKGWLFLDGSIVPIFQRPCKDGASYYTRKANYGFNVQILNLPETLRIVDVGAGHTGSAHDSNAVRSCSFFQNPYSLLAEDEFIWTDSGYPCLPYMMPAVKGKEVLSDSAQPFYYYNKTLAHIRICSEHAIGYLKGRFQCLRGLRVQIEGDDDHERAVHYIMACIIAHNIAMEFDARWQRDEMIDRGTIENDPETAATSLGNIDAFDSGSQKRQWLRDQLHEAYLSRTCVNSPTMR